MTVGHSEAEPVWTEFLRSLTRRGLRGVKLLTSDAHDGLKAAIAKVLVPGRSHRRPVLRASPEIVTEHG